MTTTLIFLTTIFCVSVAGSEQSVVLSSCCDQSEYFHEGSCKLNILETRSNRDEYLQWLESKGISIRFKSIGNFNAFCKNSSFIQYYKKNASQRILDIKENLKWNATYFPSSQYCVSRLISKTKEIELAICNPPCSAEAPCIRKCCELGEVWDISKYPSGPVKCRKSGPNVWHPHFYKDVISNSKLEKADSLSYRSISDHPRNWCRGNIIIETLTKQHKFPVRNLFRVTENGTVFQKIRRKTWIRLDDDMYCIDGMQNSTYFQNNVSTYYSGNYEKDTILFTCITQENMEKHSPCLINLPNNPSAGYGICLGISSVFLLTTVFVYLVLLDKQNIHGWTSICYFVSLFFMYVFTTLSRYGHELFTQTQVGHNWPCFLIGVFTHFFWLASFSWMTVLNFDVWFTFRSLMPTGNKSKGLKRFLAYFVFATAVPSAIIAVAVGLDIAFRDELERDLILAEYGKLYCFLDFNYAILPYLYAPIGTLLCCNLVFFSLTMYSMYKIHQSTKFASRNSSKNPRQKQSVKLFARLFLLMGIPWVTEIISWSTTPCNQVFWYWAIFDYINILQAVAIFFTFVCKEDIKRELQARFPTLRRISECFSISPEKSSEMLERRPGLRFILGPLTSRGRNLAPVPSAKTTTTMSTSDTRVSRSRSNSARLSEATIG